MQSEDGGEFAEIAIMKTRIVVTITCFVEATYVKDSVPMGVADQLVNGGGEILEPREMGHSGRQHK